MIVRLDSKLYRVPTQQKMTRAGFAVFQKHNQGCEIMIYALDGGYVIAPLDQLEFVSEEVRHESQVQVRTQSRYTGR